MKPQMTAAPIKARPRARLSVLSDQCMQRRLRFEPTAERSVTHQERQFTSKGGPDY